MRLPWMPKLRGFKLGLVAGLFAGSFFLSSGGCGDELGPERFETTSVRGSVQIGGRPVGGGYIEFHPAAGTRGNLRVGPIGPDGSFTLNRVPVGAVVIGLARLPVASVPSVRGPVDPRIFRITGPVPIRRTIPPGSPAQLPPIDLIEEAARSARRPSGRRRKRTKSSGLAPGLGRSSQGADDFDEADGERPRSSGSLTIRVVHRDEAGAIHLDYPGDRLAETIAVVGGTTWVDIENLDSAHNPRVEALLRDTFHFHPLAIEDALKDVHVPRIDDWGDYLYLAVDTLDFHPETDALQLHELDLFVGANFLVTYHHEPIRVIDRHRRAIAAEPDERLSQGAGHLLHRLLDEVVDEFIPAIEHLDVAIDDAQNEVFDNATPATLRRIFQVRNAALQLHRVVIPMREVLNRLARDPYPQVRTEDRVYFRDVYDHLVRVLDSVESLRDLIGGALDTYLSIVSNRTNDIMKVLTILNVMFLPMTFLAGFFGMNFFGDTLMFSAPILPKTVLFWLTVTIMILTPVAMWAVARLRGWF